jgi:hypothetical protein
VVFLVLHGGSRRSISAVTSRSLPFRLPVKSIESGGRCCIPLVDGATLYDRTGDEITLDEVERITI